MVMLMMIACGIPVLFLYTVLHYPGVSDSQAPFCGPLQRKRKIVLERNCSAAEYSSKNERTEGGRNGWAIGHFWFTVRIVIAIGLLVLLNLFQKI